MGMDVLGIAPTSEKGDYFGLNVWGWHPLWGYCAEISDVAARVENGHSNDGDGLNAADAKLLAQELKRSIDNGQWASFIQRLNERAAETPGEPPYDALLPKLLEFADFLEDCGGFKIW